jgi:hypothetical protein
MVCGHGAILVLDIEEAIRQRDMRPDWTVESLALYTQAAIQGAFILAKATHGAAVAAQCIDHLRRHLELLFNQPQATNEKTICRRNGQAMPISSTPKSDPVNENGLLELLSPFKLLLIGVESSMQLHYRNISTHG